MDPTHVLVKGPENKIVEVVQLFAWIGAAIRNAEGEKIEYCEAKICKLDAAYSRKFILPTKIYL
jgi:hypothetical protein